MHCAVTTKTIDQLAEHLIKQKSQTFADCSFSNVRICCFLCFIKFIFDKNKILL